MRFRDYTQEEGDFVADHERVDPGTGYSGGSLFHWLRLPSHTRLPLPWVSETSSSRGRAELLESRARTKAKGYMAGARAISDDDKLKGDPAGDLRDAFHANTSRLAR